VALFPDRIVLKNSTDTESAIEAAIESGGTDEISTGEVVLGLRTGSAKIYTKDAAGNIVTISGGSGEGGGGRGDGGDFNTGTVDITFAFGVYGGGDFNAGTDDPPIEITGGDEGPDAGSF